MKMIEGDLCSESDLDETLSGVSVVLHLAAAPMRLTQETKDVCEEFHRDNVRGSCLRDRVSATSTLVDKMLEKKVHRLVFVGDAYANLPIDDNYGGKGVGKKGLNRHVRGQP